MKQKVNDNSTAIQVAGDWNPGITCNDARNIALDVFNANCLELSKKAAAIGQNRIERFVNDLLQKLSKEDQSVVDKLQEPSIQYALFNVQKEYIKTEDTELQEYLLRPV